MVAGSVVMLEFLVEIDIDFVTALCNFLGLRFLTAACPPTFDAINSVAIFSYRPVMAAKKGISLMDPQILGRLQKDIDSDIEFKKVSNCFYSV